MKVDGKSFMQKGFVEILTLNCSFCSLPNRNQPNCLMQDDWQYLGDLLGAKPDLQTASTR